MNWLDGLLLVIFAYATFDGFRHGFVTQVFELLAWLVALLAALRWFQPLADWLVWHYHWPILLSKPLAFIGIWFLANTLFLLLLHLAYNFLPTRVKTSFLNRGLGVGLGWLKAFVYAGLLLTMLASVPLPAALSEQLDHSRLAPLAITQTRWLTHRLEERLGGSFTETFNFLTTPKEDSFTNIQPVSADKLHAEPVLEEKLLGLVNEERARVGLAQLAMDDSLREVARAHSYDMWLRGFFAHENPDGASPFDRMTAAGITFTVAGENLALAPTVDIAHIGLMRSPTHRENILHPDFGRVGIGIVSAGANGMMVTQDFRD